MRPPSAWSGDAIQSLRIIDVSRNPSIDIIAEGIPIQHVARVIEDAKASMKTKHANVYKGIKEEITAQVTFDVLRRHAVDEWISRDELMTRVLPDYKVILAHDTAHARELYNRFGNVIDKFRRAQEEKRGLQRSDQRAIGREFYVLLRGYDFLDRKSPRDGRIIEYRVQPCK